MDHPTERLERLAADLGVAEAAIDDLAHRLDSFAVPEPPAHATAALIERLRAHVPAPPRRRFRDEGLSTSPAEIAWGWLRVQAGLFRPVWWLVSALAIPVWLLLVEATGVAPALLAPPLVAAGVAYAFREVGSPAMEVELSAPVRPVHVMLVRMLLVMGWTGLLGALLAGALHLAGHPLALWPALAAWAAGVLFFGGVTLVAMLAVGARGALVVALALWAGVLLWQAAIRNAGPAAWFPGNGLTAAVGLGLVLTAVMLQGRLLRLPREEG